MPTSKWEFSGPYRCEWICEHGVGHYDHNLMNNTIHGCDGCCRHDDFPPHLKDDSYYAVLKDHKIKSSMIFVPPGMPEGLMKPFDKSKLEDA